MATFELRSSNCDGHIRALSKAILMSSKISKEALLEFTPEKMRLCARTDHILVKFVFVRDFFSDYSCETRHRCFVSLKALFMPFKSSIVSSEKDSGLRSQVRLRCSLEDSFNNQLVFRIGAEPPAATLTYRLAINDLDPDRMAQLNAINRTIDYARAEMAPKQNKKERFLLSAFNSFAPDIDQVTIKTSQSEVKFIGSVSPLANCSHMTSEFTHKRDDFSTFNVKEDVSITVPLRFLKLFLGFVENTKVQTFPKYIFEGMGFPAHFIYDASLFKGHYVSATPYEYVPEELDSDNVLPIAVGGPDDSFIADENVIQADDHNGSELFEYLPHDDEAEEMEDYDDVASEGSDLLDGDLSGLNATNQHHRPNTTICGNSTIGAESIRSAINDTIVDLERAREILDLSKDPEEVEAISFQYSSDSDSDDY